MGLCTTRPWPQECIRLFDIKINWVQSSHGEVTFVPTHKCTPLSDPGCGLSSVLLPLKTTLPLASPTINCSLCNSRVWLPVCGTMLYWGRFSCSRPGLGWPKTALNRGNVSIGWTRSTDLYRLTSGTCWLLLGTERRICTAPAFLG